MNTNQNLNGLQFLGVIKLIILYQYILEQQVDFIKKKIEKDFFHGCSCIII